MEGVGDEFPPSSTVICSHTNCSQHYPYRAKFTLPLLLSESYKPAEMGVWYLLLHLNLLRSGLPQ